VLAVGAPESCKMLITTFIVDIDMVDFSL